MNENMIMGKLQKFFESLKNEGEVTLITVKLLHTRCFVGSKEIKRPYYITSKDVEVGDTITVPVGRSHNNPAKIVSIETEWPPYYVRTIDDVISRKG